MDEKKICRNCKREVEILETPIDDVWVHTDTGIGPCSVWKAGEWAEPEGVKMIQPGELTLVEVSLDKEPNAFGYGIENVEVLHED